MPGREGIQLSIAAACPRCGFANVQGQRFCPNCGNGLILVGSPPAPPSPPPAYPYGGPPPGYPPPYYAPPPMKRATAGTMIGDTFGVFGKDFPLYVGIFLVYAAISVGITFGLTALFLRFPSPTVAPTGFDFSAFGTDVILAFIGLSVGVAIINAIVEAVVVGTIAYVAVQRYRGMAVTLRQALDQGIKRFLSILGAGIVIGLIVVGLILVPLGVLLAGAVTLNLGLIGIGVLLLLVFGTLVLYLVLAWCLYAPVIMIEGQTALRSLSRSWELTRGHRLSIFGAGFAIAIIAAIVSVALSFPFGLTDNLYFAAIGSVLATAITGSWILILTAVAYQLIIAGPGYGAWYPAPVPASPPSPPAPPAPPAPPSAPPGGV